ncbi:hypothetical protein FEM48_Zijuj08G0057100 [Ziziphus jujuba var. spinosa]|uniref:C2H2-type domain-containing protein n=1 Tax=Ziziphus jujuba var. spinosa TaxID=714518 RepID=A0A978UXB0_ZIZJJ|nr:hypothetical protein FEM48_Zijuj08G0057100 [Ziziphus jujuba var. spinosa]
MEKHKCKLCLRSFSNGRALGGHMRSHMMNLPVPPKPEDEEESPPPPPPPPPQPQQTQSLQPQPHPIQLTEEAESASSSSSSSDEEGTEDGDEEKLGAYYGLRENPKRSIRLGDPEFSFAVDAGSVVLQDRESETESSKNPTRRRSKRTRKSGMSELQYHHHHHQKIEEQEEGVMNNNNKIKFNKLSKTESWAEPEPVSSVSDTTTEEDVAFCLMMLSRDKWKKQEQQRDEKEDQEEEQEDEGERSLEDTDESEELKSSKNRTRGKYKCETCKKVFRSYQALGGHRASHKKIKLSNPTYEAELVQENAGTSSFIQDKKIHECPVCFRVFSSGQALGGHKRSHVTGSSATNSVKSLIKFGGDSLIDLNLPAPMDDDEISQIELSAVSDAEFVKTH